MSAPFHICSEQLACHHSPYAKQMPLHIAIAHMPDSRSCTLPSPQAKQPPLHIAWPSGQSAAPAHCYSPYAKQPPLHIAIALRPKKRPCILPNLKPSAAHCTSVCSRPRVSFSPLPRARNWNLPQRQPSCRHVFRPVCPPEYLRK